jgi:hypothetical protein
VELDKEGEGLVPDRGLVTANVGDNAALNDNQAFLIYLTEAVRAAYNARMLQQLEQVGGGGGGRGPLNILAEVPVNQYFNARAVGSSKPPTHCRPLTFTPLMTAALLQQAQTFISTISHLHCCVFAAGC